MRKPTLKQQLASALLHARDTRVEVWAMGCSYACERKGGRYERHSMRGRVVHEARALSLRPEDETMTRTYREFQPTGFDSRANFIAYDSEAIDSIQSWLVGPSRTRDSDCLEESNFAVILKDLGGEGDNVQVHRFGHWACGWYELILIRPETPEAASWAEWEGALANYPVASDEDFSEREGVAADETWRDCYSDAQRIEYMRRHKSQFDCLYDRCPSYVSDGGEQYQLERWRDILANARGRRFDGYASDLIG